MQADQIHSKQPQSLTQSRIKLGAISNILLLSVASGQDKDFPRCQPWLGFVLVAAVESMFTICPEDLVFT